MSWNTTPNTTVPRAEAIGKITEKARNEGISGSFKVFYNDELVANPNDLPEQVDMTQVRVSAVLDNA